MPVNAGEQSPTCRCGAESAYQLGQQAFENDVWGHDDPAIVRHLDTLGPLERMDAWWQYQRGWLDAAAQVPASEYDFGDENDEPGPGWRECWHGWPKDDCPNCHRDPSGRGSGREEVGY